MKKAPSGPDFPVSQTLYGRLLLAYPPAHRTAYGPAMTQLFRDQCRDAWQESGAWGLLKLWFRILPDLVSTSILERLAALKERKTMTDKLANLFSFRMTPASAFFKTFALVFVAVFLVSVAITYLLPEIYASTARLKVESEAPATGGPSPAYDPYFIQTTFEIIQSESVLKSVINKLDLNTAWGKKYFAGETLKTPKTLELLKLRLQLSPVKNTGLIDVTAYSDDKNEAARLANAVAESYQDYRSQARSALAQQTAAALQRQFTEQEAQIQHQRAELDALQARFGIPDNIEGLGVILANAEKSVREKNIQLSQLRSLGREQQRNALSTMMSDGALSGLLGKLHEAEQNYASLTNDYSLTNVVVMRVTSLMAVLNQQIDDRVEGILAGMESQLASSKAVSEGLAAKVQKSKPLPETQAYWDEKQALEQSVESQKLWFAKMEQQKLEAQLPKPMPVQTIDTAEPGDAPVRPNKPVDICLGAIMGILLASAAGTAFAFLLVLAGKRRRNAATALKP